MLLEGFLMLRLIIVDDEKIIRETISSIIDWKSLDIELIGVCKDGIEAYDMIIDEYPDIVLTDIKMPGLSGLELIEKIRELDKNIQFIILSGYEEFSFAKKAMKYGVKHYLLKPCNEAQIIEVVKQVATDCYQVRALEEIQKNHKKLKENLDENIMRNIIMESLAHRDDLKTIIKQYQHYIDFTNTNYELYYLHYLTDQSLKLCIQAIRTFLATTTPGLIPHFVYVTNTLLLFFKSENALYDELSIFFKDLEFEGQAVSIEYHKQSFSNLYSLLETLLKKINRYEFIYLIHDNHLITTYNHNSLFIKINHILDTFSSKEDFDKELFLSEIKEALAEIEDESLLRAVITTLLMKITNSNLIPFSPMHITDFLVEMNDISGCHAILQVFLDKFSSHLTIQPIIQSEYKGFIEKTLHYVNEHLSNPNLSLKWIAENYLYMNVDYLSKQFIKETGYKFSYYLTSKRIEKAKQLLLEDNVEKIYTVAEQVGCGNNPQYFSQIFKKHTGMTPTAYIKKMAGE